MLDLHPMKLPLRSGGTGLVGTIQRILKRRTNLRLRTKFLLSLVLVTAGLTCVTLLVVHRYAAVQAQREIEAGARNAMLTFQVLQHQQQIALSRKADLLATLAYMRNGDATTIQDVSEDPWQSDECRSEEHTSELQSRLHLVCR